jgi:NAD(P)-dependent dehydrogenase (short-subunit alcohol dehydrogenase family)
VLGPVHGVGVPAEVLVTGASSGIGLAMVECLLADPMVARVFATSRHAESAEGVRGLAARHGSRLVPIDADLATDAGIDAVAGRVRADSGVLHLVVHCAGVLHEGLPHDEVALQPERALAQLQRQGLERAFALNAFAPVLLARALLPCFDRASPLVFASLSARVGSIGDNRLGGWYAYRASKAAQNQLMRTLAIEWARTHPRACCVLLHPGTVDTPLSRPYQAGVRAQALFTAERAARQLLDIIQRLGPGDSGRFLAWDGQDVPW